MKGLDKYWKWLRALLYGVFFLDVVVIFFYWYGRVDESTASSDMGRLAVQAMQSWSPIPYQLAVVLVGIWFLARWLKPKKSKKTVESPPEEEPDEDEEDEDESGDEGQEEPPPAPKSKPKPNRKRGLQLDTTTLLLIGVLLAVLYFGLTGNGMPNLQQGVFKPEGAATSTPGLQVPTQPASSDGGGDLIGIVFDSPLILLFIGGAIAVGIWFYQRRTSFLMTWVTNVGENETPIEITLRVIYHRSISGILNYIQLTRGNRRNEVLEGVSIDESDESEAVLWVTAVVRSLTDQVMGSYETKDVRSKKRGEIESQLLARLSKSKRLHGFGMVVTEIAIEDVNDIEEVEEVQAQNAAAQTEGDARATTANRTVSGIQARRKDANEEPLTGMQAWVIELISVFGEAARDIARELVVGKGSFSRPEDELPPKTTSKRRKHG